MSQLLGKIGKVYVVNGAPGSGKSTYVRTNKRFGDIVLDVDYLHQCFTGSDTLYRVNKASIALGSMVYELIISKSFEITCSGRDLWIVMAEADKSKVDQLVSELNATLIEMNADANVCKSNIEADDRRKWKQYYYNQVDKWFDVRLNGRPNKDTLTSEELLEFYNNLSGILNDLNIDYYLTGSITAMLNYGIDFGRPHGDIDLYIRNEDVLKFKQYCDNNGWKFISLLDTEDIMFKYGHVCCVMPFENSSFHIGMFPFTAQDVSFVHHSFFYRYGYLHSRRLYYREDSCILDYLKDHPHVLPYEYSMIFKLSHARKKDFDDFDLVRPYFDFDLFKAIKNDFRNSTYELILFRDGEARVIESGDFVDCPA